MREFRSYGLLDDSPRFVEDKQWFGVDMRSQPWQVQPGLCCAAVNQRFTNGRPEPRAGLRILAWGARAQAGYGPGDVVPYGTVAGSGIFNDPVSGQTWIIIATIGGVFRTQPGTTGSKMAFPAGEVIPSKVQIIQTFNGLVMLRGRGLDPLYCDNLDEGWRVPPAVSIPGKMRIPPSSFGVYFQNRLFLIYEGGDSAVRDSIWVSDFGLTIDALQGSVAYNGFRINQGSRDSLLALFPFGETSLLAFKGESVYLVSGIAGTNEDIALNARLDVVTTEYGIAAPRSIVQVGADVWFLAANRGLVSIRQTQLNKLQGVDVPVSLDIDPLIRQIAWGSASGAAAAFWDNRVYFAVPTGASAVNNRVLVFDSRTGKWAGYDEADAIKVREWVRFQLAGRGRLAFVSTDGYLVLYEDGGFDQVGLPLGKVGFAEIRTRLLTRGFAVDPGSRNTFTELRLNLSTWAPRYTLSVWVDGVEEGSTVARDQTVDPTRYDRPHGRAPWDASNAADDWAEPYRQDYALSAPVGGMVCGSGVAAEVYQQSQRAFRLRERGSFVQLEVVGSAGRTIVDSVRVVCDSGSSRAARQL